MGHPLQHGRDLPEHMTAQGDKVVARITIDVMASGALRCYGDIGDQRWALAALDNAKDAIKSHHAQQLGHAIVRPEDVKL